jgi:ParB family chromosome partitioning protein
MVHLKWVIRDNADPSRAAGLVATLKDGQLMPVIVWQDDDWFHLVDGHRRFDATVSLGFETIEARVLDKLPGEGEALQKALICNTQREALSPLALAQAIADLIEATGWTAAEAANRIGMSAPTVSRLLSLLLLPEPIKEQIRAGKLSASTAAELVKVSDPAKQAALAEKAVDGQLTRDAASGHSKSDRSVGTAIADTPPARIKMPLGGGRSVTVSGAGLSLENLIACLEELLNKARKARTRAWELGTLVRALKDQAKG